MVVATTHVQLDCGAGVTITQICPRSLMANSANHLCDIWSYIVAQSIIIDN